MADTKAGREKQARIAERRQREREIREERERAEETEPPVVADDVAVESLAGETAGTRSAAE